MPYSPVLQKYVIKRIHLTAVFVRILIASLSMIAILPNFAFAGTPHVSGFMLFPLEETSVVPIRNTVSIDPDGNVKAGYWLKNRSDTATTVVMGFPNLRQEYEKEVFMAKDDNGSHVVKRREYYFRVMSEGKVLESIEKIVNLPNSAKEIIGWDKYKADRFKHLHVWEMVFAGEQERHIEAQYSVQWGYEDECEDICVVLQYFNSPGLLWNNRLEYAEFFVEAPWGSIPSQLRRGEMQIRAFPTNHTVKNKTSVTWHFEDWKPKETIFVGFEWANKRKKQ